MLLSRPAAKETGDDFPMNGGIMLGEVVTGLLGWSNKRGGVEFYRYDPETIPRHESEWGDLLALEDGPVKDAEGSPVIVVVLPRATSEADLQAIELLVRSSLVGRVFVNDPRPRASGSKGGTA